MSGWTVDLYTETLSIESKFPKDSEANVLELIGYHEAIMHIAYGRLNYSTTLYTCYILVALSFKKGLEMNILYLFLIFLNF